MKQENYPENLYATHFVQEGVAHPHLYIAEDSKVRKSLWGHNFCNSDCGVKYIREDLIPKWHKYPEEKPTVDEYVLFCDDFEVSYGWYDEHGNWRDCDNYCVHGVKAWMELPKLYKED